MCSSDFSNERGIYDDVYEQIDAVKNCSTRVEYSL